MYKAYTAKSLKLLLCLCRKVQRFAPAASPLRGIFLLRCPDFLFAFLPPWFFIGKKGCKVIYSNWSNVFEYKRKSFLLFPHIFFTLFLPCDHSIPQCRRIVKEFCPKIMHKIRGAKLWHFVKLCLCLCSNMTKGKQKKPGNYSPAFLMLLFL